MKKKRYRDNAEKFFKRTGLDLRFDRHIKLLRMRKKGIFLSAYFVERGKPKWDLIIDNIGLN